MTLSPQHRLPILVAEVQRLHVPQATKSTLTGTMRHLSSFNLKLKNLPPPTLDSTRVCSREKRRRNIVAAYALDDRYFLGDPQHHRHCNTPDDRPGISLHSQQKEKKHSQPRRRDNSSTGHTAQDKQHKGQHKTVRKTNNRCRGANGPGPLPVFTYVSKMSCNSPHRIRRGGHC